MITGSPTDRRSRDSLNRRNLDIPLSLHRQSDGASAAAGSRPGAGSQTPEGRVWEKPTPLGTPNQLSRTYGSGTSSSHHPLTTVLENGAEGTATNMFELFRMHDGEEYTVYTRDDGKRFYVDWEEQKWRYFPESWYPKGTFTNLGYDPYQNSKVVSKKTQGRWGEFIHPTRGKLTTLLKQETLNVCYFFDDSTGTWLPMPLSWERHIPDVQARITEIQDTFPEWKDTKAILGLLRQCNYNVEESINVYQSMKDDGVMDHSDGTSRNVVQELLEKKLTQMSANLKAVKEENREQKNKIEQLENKVEELIADNKRLNKELQSGREEQRRQSRAYRMTPQHPQSIRKPAGSLRPALQLLREEAHTIKSVYSLLQSQTVKGLKNLSNTFQELSGAITQLSRNYSRQCREIADITALYRREALQRKLLYNEVQELRGNIRVFCRCRQDDRSVCALQFDKQEGRVMVKSAQGRKKMFEFERVYVPTTTQEEIFEDTKPTILSCVDGYNVCIIAYGQTGAGKTYTMTGPQDNPGVNIRSVKELFKSCRQRETIRYTMKVSIVEIYNEAIFDLLVPRNEGIEKLQIQTKGKDIMIPGLTEIEVCSVEEVLTLMSEGEKNRTVASTKMNTNSSRSHLLLMLRVEGYDKVSKVTSHGRLTLVDLAGSERISRSEATGIRLVEAAAINKSLSALGQVFASIREGSLHIPYRNSKLTHVLQPCIGGDSKACMFVNVSPLLENTGETISSLEFGQNVRQVELGKATKHLTRQE